MPKAINLENIRQEIKELVSEVSEIPVADLKDEAKFGEEVEVDSMMALEIVAKIEKKYKVTISEEDIPKVRSIKNVYELVENRLNK
ncbi:acyl carrier protein [Candidatus Omnitrophota bacterium]